MWTVGIRNWIHDSTLVGYLIEPWIPDSLMWTLGIRNWIHDSTLVGHLIVVSEKIDIASSI